jgi:hypothetical protein
LTGAGAPAGVPAGDVGAVKAALVAAYAADVDKVFAAGREAFGGDRGGRALEALEPLAQDAGAAASSGLLQAVVALAAGGEPAAAVCPGCGARGRMVAVRPKTVGTLAGPIAYERRYFQCGACREGFAPFDSLIGVEGKTSAGMGKALALAGAEMPYARAAKLIEVFTGHQVASASTVNRVAVAQGRRAQAGIDREAALARAGRSEPAFAAGAPDKIYIVMDGTGAPMLPREVNPESGKAPDGRAKTREVKIGVVFTQSGLGPGGEPVQDPGSQSYVATFDGCDEFAARLRDEARRRGVGQIRQPVVLGDGAKWIKTIADRDYPQATRIVDWFHAAEHIHDLGKLLEPVLEERDEWVDARLDDLHRGDTPAIAAAVAALKLDRTAPHLAKPAAREAKYFTSNHAAMQYRHFEEDLHLFIGSGNVESACASVVACRAKRPGMHWTITGLAPILALRVISKSDRLGLVWLSDQHPERHNLAA